MKTNTELTKKATKNSTEVQKVKVGSKMINIWTKLQ